MNLFIKKRKREHLQIVKERNTKSNNPTYLDDIIFVPKSLPELNLGEIDTSIEFLGRKLLAPILISSMTGGTEEAHRINQQLARQAEKHGLAFSVGSQKAMINHPEIAYTYKVKDVAPNVFLIGNIGIDYLLSEEFDLEKLKKSLEEIQADALYIHINPLQELIQPEGARDFKGAFEKIEFVCKNIKMPILIKEVGDGIDPETAKKLEGIGISAIDIAGSGGTSWAAVEGFRGNKLGESFRDWGLSTALSLISVKKISNLPLIASGGLQSGQDIAKSLALGATLGGIARPFIVALFKGGEKELEHKIEETIAELKINMLLIGASNIAELKNSRYLVRGELGNLVKQI